MKSSFVFFFALVANCINAQNSGIQQIQLNQIGFYPSGNKIAVVTAQPTGNKFYVVTLPKKDTVFIGQLSTPVSSVYSSTITQTADFSALHQTGKFFISVEGIGNSYPFSIENNVHKSVVIAALKGFYYQRSDMPLLEKYAGKWARSAGHPDTAVIVHASAATGTRPKGYIIRAAKGWYDAGDYNKYIVNSGITMGTLLSAYEDFPNYFTRLTTNIPETGNGLPDILNETLYNLRWMLTMQDEDGGVYNKCTGANFDKMEMPNATKLPRYVVQKSTAATLDFSAVTAQAARVFARFKTTKALSDSCLKASKSAWAWAIQNPKIEYNQTLNNKTFLPAITTGGYGDNHFEDEFFWAAAELYSSTGENIYLEKCQTFFSKNLSLPSWSNVESLGLYTLMRKNKSISLNGTLLSKQLLHFADQLLKNGGNKAFGTIMGQSKDDYNWGSNSVAANQGILLINAYLISKDKKYSDAALTNLDYLLGRNATGYCFVTGFGSKQVMHPHHRPSVADGILEPVPGLLSGGPNIGKQDHCNGYLYNEVENSFLDDDCSYSTNEIAINWNAPLVYLVNALEAVMAENSK